MNSLFKTRFILFTIIFIGMKMTSFAQEKKENTLGAKIATEEVATIKAMVIKATVPSKEIGSKMGELYGKLFGYLGQKQIQPVGAPFAVYYDYNPSGNATFEVGVPVGSLVKSDGDINYKEFPAMKVLKSLFVGSYDKIGTTYEAIEKYIKENNIQTAGTCWEVYLTDPAKVKDPNENQTVVYYVLK